MTGDDARSTNGSRAGTFRVLVFIAAPLLGLAFVGLMIGGFVAWSCSSLPLGEDSWRHYAGGGSFVTEAPDLSAEGSQTVFASPKTGHGDVYLVDVQSGQTRRLTTSGNCDLSPCFRPHRQQILFEREHNQRRHVWLVNLSTGDEQQLTDGEWLDDILDVSPNGQHALLGRSAVARGFGKQMKARLLDLDVGRIANLPDNFFGYFRGDGKTLVGANRSNGTYSIVELRLDGSIVKNYGSGYTCHGIDSQRKCILVGRQTKEFEINSELSVWNLETGKRESIGTGHYACMFDNGKVLFLTGYERDAWIWESGRGTRRIDSPKTVINVPRRASGNRAGVFVFPWNSNEPNPYLFDAETEKFERIPWSDAIPSPE